MTAISPSIWEYRDFTYRQWRSDEIWCSLAGAEKGSDQQARAFIWKQAHERIEATIAQWRAEGWEPAEPVGPEAITFHTFTQNSFSFSLADVVMWVLTFGVGLIMQLALNLPRQYVIYEPVEFHIHMMKCGKGFAKPIAALPSETVRL